MIPPYQLPIRHGTRLVSFNLADRKLSRTIGEGVNETMFSYLPDILDVTNLMFAKYDIKITLIKRQT